MKEGLESLVHAVKEKVASVVLNRAVDAALVKELGPDLLIWATGPLQNIPDIPGLSNQHTITALEFFTGEKEVRGPRVLLIGAGRTGIEIVEKLGEGEYEVVATKRTDPIGGMMEMITRNLTLMRIGKMPRVILMPHTAVKAFSSSMVEVEQDGKAMTLKPFQTVILASGMVSAPAPDEEIRKSVSKIEIIGDAREVKDIFAAMQAGYQLAIRY
jgi:NADH dehydrogenase FAD-containing subunit